MKRSQRVIMILVAVAVVLPVVYHSRRTPHPGGPAAFSVMTSTRGFVRISGEVRHPGMYSVFANMLTVDVISMALPLQPVSLLEPTGVGNVPIRNGEALHLSAQTDGRTLVTRGAIPVAERIAMDIPLDIDSMSEADLIKIPGVGPVLAGNIFRYRQNNGGHMSARDLLLIDGVGEKKYELLRKFF